MRAIGHAHVCYPLPFVEDYVHYIFDSNVMNIFHCCSIYLKQIGGCKAQSYLILEGNHLFRGSR